MRPAARRRAWCPDASRRLRAGGRAEEERELDLRVEHPVGRLLALEAQPVDRGDRYFAQNEVQEMSQRRVLPVNRQRDAIRDEARLGSFQPVLRLLELQARGARKTMHALDLTGEASQRREALVELRQIFGAVRDRP